jgi:hypothetical protein
LTELEDDLEEVAKPRSRSQDPPCLVKWQREPALTIMEAGRGDDLVSQLGFRGLARRLAAARASTREANDLGGWALKEGKSCR